MLIRKIGPAIWLSCIAFAWGALSLGIGFINTWEALAIMRAFLGVLEAVSLPVTYAALVLCLLSETGLLSRLHIPYRILV